MAPNTEMSPANSNGAQPNGSAGVWSRLESVRDVLRDQSRHATEVAGRQLAGAQRKVVGTVRAKPVTVSLVTAGLALLAAGTVFALRNPSMIRGFAKTAQDTIRRRF